LLEPALESVIRKLTIHTYKAQVALRETMIETLATEFEGENLTVKRKAEIARHWDKTLKGKYAFQLMLDLLERQRRENLD
jgi:hypothetical protein